MIATASFIVAAVATVGGVVLLAVAHVLRWSRSRRRRRWARARRWSYTEVDPGLPARWRWGSVHEHGPGLARDLVTGAVPCPDGKRLGHVFDHEHDGRAVGCVAAVRGIRTVPEAMELRTRPPEGEIAGLERADDVAGRAVFVTGGSGAVSPEVAEALAQVGADVPLVWLEDVWVLGCAPVGTTPERLEQLIVALGEVSAALDRTGSLAVSSGPDGVGVPAG